MLRSRLRGPHSETTHRKRRTMPGNSNTTFEFRGILRMNMCAVSHSLANALVRSQRGEFHGVEAPDIRSEKHALATIIKPRIRVGDVSYGQVRVSNTPINVFVFFPESPLELQADLHDRCVRHGGYCRCQ